MRKGKQIIVFLLMGLAALAVVSCSSGNGEELMNFHAEIEWKIPDPALGERPRILFVGNSHTFYNNFSGMFVNIVEAKGKKSSVYELSQGYYTLKKFSDLEDKGGALLDKTLNKQAWDIVVLQENSQEALSETADEDMFPYARILDEKIRARGGQTAFFSRRNCQMWKNPQNIVDNVDNCVDNCEDKSKNAVESLGKCGK